MALSFPSSPVVDQLYRTGNRWWRWTGVAWNFIPILDVGRITSLKLGGVTPTVLITSTSMESSGASLRSNVFVGSQKINGGLDVTGPAIFQDGINLKNTTLNNVRRVSFGDEPELSGTTGVIVVDWSESANWLQPEPTGNITYDFVPPEGIGHFQIRIDSDGTTTARTFTFPSNVIQYIAPFQMTANKKHILNFFWDGSFYHLSYLTEA